MSETPPVPESEMAALPDWARAMIQALYAQIAALRAEVAELSARGCAPTC